MSFWERPGCRGSAVRTSEGRFQGEAKEVRLRYLGGDSGWRTLMLKVEIMRKAERPFSIFQLRQRTLVVSRHKDLKNKKKKCDKVN